MNGLEVISVLEEKIDTLLSYVAKLEEDKRNLENQLEEERNRVSELSARVETLENERADVGARVERILSKIGEVAAASSEESHHEEVNQDHGQGEGDLQFSDAG